MSEKVKSNKTLYIIIAIAAVIGLFLVSTYNGLVSTRETVSSKLADIDTQLQRRSDLIPNLVNTVKGYMAHEEDIINKITDARASMTSATTVAEKAEANNQLTEAIHALNVVVENYPDLKASENFTQLSDELAGTENRISTARKDYNEVVKKYNTKIKNFPDNLVAGMFGFSESEYFEADEGAEKVPSVNFGE